MGAVLLLTPVVVAAWPVFATAVASAAASLGYAKAENSRPVTTVEEERAIELEVPRSEVVTGQLGRDQKITVEKEGVTVTFRRDERGKASLTVRGTGQSEEALRSMGEELSRRVVRDYVHAQIKAEIESRHFTMVEETVDDTNTIRITVRHW